MSVIPTVPSVRICLAVVSSFCHLISSLLVCLSVYLFVGLYVPTCGCLYVSVFLLAFQCLSGRMYCLFVYVSLSCLPLISSNLVCLSVYLFVGLSVHVCGHMYVFLLACLPFSVCLSGCTVFPSSCVCSLVWLSL